MSNCELPLHVLICHVIPKMDIVCLLHSKTAFSATKNRLNSVFEKMLHKKVKTTSMHEFFKAFSGISKAIDQEKISSNLTSLIFDQLNISPISYPILFKIFKDLFLQPANTLSLLYFTRAKAILPDLLESPIGDSISVEEFLTEMTQDFRKLYVISAFMSACFIGKDATILRIRCLSGTFGFKKIKPNDITLDTDTYNFDTWDDESPYFCKNFFEKIGDHEKIDTEQLLSSGVFTRMDIASCVHNRKRCSISITGLKNVQAYNHFERTFEVDWRFVGMATMYHQDEVNDDPLKIRLSLVDHLENWRENGHIFKQLRNIKYMKMLQELNFCSASTTELVLEGFHLKIGTVLSLFNSIDSLVVIKADETHLASLHEITE